MTPQLAEALRAEIRLALEADGKAFDVNVARRVYDLAIAARDMCVAAATTTGEAIKTIADAGGPVESLQDLGTPPTVVQAAETFGVRALRELIAALRPTPAGTGVVGAGPNTVVPGDLTTWLGALAEARELGLADVAAGIEAKLRQYGILPDADPPPPRRQDAVASTTPTGAA